MWCLFLETIRWSSKGHFSSPHRKSNYPSPCQLFLTHWFSDLARNCFNQLPSLCPTSTSSPPRTPSQFLCWSSSSKPLIFLFQVWSPHFHLFFIYQTICMASSHLPYLKALESAPFPHITGTTLVEFPSKGKRVFSGSPALYSEKAVASQEIILACFQKKGNQSNCFVCLFIHLFPLPQISKLLAISVKL